MDTFNAIYENGKLKFEQKPKRKKGRVLVTFIDDKSTKAELPVFSLDNKSIMNYSFCSKDRCEDAYYCNSQ